MSTDNETQKTFTEEYISYLVDSPSPFHASNSAAKRLEHAGFTSVLKSGQWPTKPGSYFVCDEGALVAWILPDADQVTQKAQGFSIVGTHTDSPSLKLKPTPQRTTSDGWGQLLTEVYGGPLLNSWLDRELLIAGRVVDRNGQAHLVQTEPIARVPQLAIHLNRGVQSDGLKLNPQQHMQPVWTVDDQDENILNIVATRAGLNSEDDIFGFDLFFYPSQTPGLFGSKQQFVAAGRQDNLSSTFAALKAFIQLGQNPDSSRIPVLVMFDHEEIGSDTTHGAHGPFLPSALKRIANTLGKDLEEYEQMLTQTSLISADASHSVHPAYPSVHDPETRPVMGRGPILKVDADQRYATTALGAALWNRVCELADVPTQHFVSESSMRSGSTIGPGLATSLGVNTIDVGIGLLSMHSAREMSHVQDTEWLSDALLAYWSKAFPSG